MGNVFCYVMRLVQLLTAKSAEIIAVSASAIRVTFQFIVTRWLGVMKLHIKRITITLVCGAGVVLLSSCAAIFTGTKQDVAFLSPQGGGSVLVDEQKHTLPATLKISKKVDTAVFSHPKYGSKSLSWQRDFQWGFFWLDFLFTPGYGVSGFVVDGVTGAWMKHPSIINYNFKNGSTNARIKQGPKN